VGKRRGNIFFVVVDCALHTRRYADERMCEKKEIRLHREHSATVCAPLQGAVPGAWRGSFNYFHPNQRRVVVSDGGAFRWAGGRRREHQLCKPDCSEVACSNPSMPLPIARLTRFQRRRGNLLERVCWQTALAAAAAITAYSSFLSLSAWAVALMGRRDCGE